MLQAELTPWDFFRTPVFWFISAQRFVADSTEKYVGIATSALLHLQELLEIRNNLLSHTLEPLFDESEVAHHVKAMTGIIEGHALLKTEVDCTSVGAHSDIRLRIRCSHPRLDSHDLNRARAPSYRLHALSDDWVAVT
jgi:hypothetical protein